MLGEATSYALKRLTTREVEHVSPEAWYADDKWVLREPDHGVMTIAKHLARRLKCARSAHALGQATQFAVLSSACFVRRSYPSVKRVRPVRAERKAKSGGR